MKELGNIRIMDSRGRGIFRKENEGLESRIEGVVERVTLCS